MSVIYKTLKKLKTESAEESENKRISKKEKKSYPFKAVALNPGTIISISLLVLAAGAVVFFAVRSLNETANNEPQPKIFPIPQHAENMEGAEDSGEGEKKSLNVQYIPAEANKGYAGDTDAKGANASGITTQPDKKLPKTKINRTIVNPRTDGKQQGFQSLGQYSIPAKAAFSPKIPDGKKHKEKVRMQRIHRTNTERSLKISKLVERIQKNIRIDNVSRTEKLLGELELLKGKENNFVLKLRAFSYLKRNDYESAEKFLKKVLNNSEKDLEATINMAIVEIKTKRYQQAEKRLNGLRETYPENTTILQLIEKLKLSSR
ncbi:MAG: tetratricopeptide repeat protein [Desulfobacterales bacterium]|nr:tetratricopeptide repeat protein [Deltaproteobacteria bacterium]NNL43654.1 tetratricopeptide repeat protein [Desulfobacterales bacterium]